MVWVMDFLGVMDSFPCSDTRNTQQNWEITSVSFWILLCEIIFIAWSLNLISNRCLFKKKKQQTIFSIINRSSEQEQQGIQQND